MQPDIRHYYQLARQKCLRRIERTLLWVAITALAATVGIAILHFDSWGGLMVAAAYVYLWLPVAACVIVGSLLAWLLYTVKLHRLGALNK